MRSPSLALVAVAGLFTLYGGCTDAPETPLAPDAPALAQGSPSYRTADYAAASGLFLDFKQSGLGSFQSVPYTLTGKLIVTDFQCINGGNNLPQGDPTQIEVIVTTTEVFPVSNGQVTGHLEIAGDVGCHANGHFPTYTDLRWEEISHTWGAGNAGPVPPGALLNDGDAWSCKNKSCEMN